ncbi:hypothetical protein GE061_001119 [Apolygus lucorum]|uniref:Retrotransposon gag domain-containing protein n=1 Tax=Apolygus lucorum TaxID=248454 RepID=A0A6A4K128_APOLU|nr:hypothetical protein GE061_001119 [Apolygus lucorum]
MATGTPTTVQQHFLAMMPTQLQQLIDSMRGPAQRPKATPDRTDYSGIPEFSGEPELLNQFFERCQEIIDHFFDEEDEDCFANKVILNNIRAKIKGKAATGIFNAPLNTWDVIKKALVANYDDKRDEEHLILEFGKLRQHTNENPSEFHTRVYNKLLMLLITKLKNSHEQFTVTTLKLIEKVALRAFSMGLHEDIGRLLITKGPADLNDAIKILTNEYQFPNLRKKYLEKQKAPFPQKTLSQNYLKVHPPIFETIL